ncbi:MAG: hypothetical protein GF313_16345 [Caldithrix sp.]|nr:hypothetical protein [Caldithrix sp.]
MQRPQLTSAQSHQINISCILSGHLMFGIGYEYGINEHHAATCNVYPLLLPGVEELPFAISAGYGFYTGQEHWKGRLGLEYTMIVSPPDPDKRKVLPMVSFLSGLQYSDKRGNHYLSQIYVARFLKEARAPVAPIGIELRFGREL